MVESSRGVLSFKGALARRLLQPSGFRHVHRAQSLAFQSGLRQRLESNYVVGPFAVGLGCAVLVLSIHDRFQRRRSSALRADDAANFGSVYSPWLSASDSSLVRVQLTALGSVETPTKAWLVPRRQPGVDVDDGSSLHILWSQLNFSGNRTLQFVTSVELPRDMVSTTTSYKSGPCWDLGAPAAVVPSRSGARTLVVKNGSGGGSSVEKPEGSILEVWGKQRLICELFLDARVLTDPYFSSFDWDATEEKICFVAEPSPSKGPALGEDTVGKFSWEGESLYDQDWGEQLVGLRVPRVYVLDVPGRKVSQIRPPQDDSACGQCVWSPSSNEVVYTAWCVEDPLLGRLRRPGLIYCYNRPCSLYSSSVNEPLSKPMRLISPTFLSSAFAPSFSPDGRTLAFLSLDAAVASGTHNATQELFTVEWDSNSAATGFPSPNPPRCVVPVIRRPACATSFPGLYAARLSPQHWIDASTLVLNTLWRCDEAIVALDVRTGALRRLTPSASSDSGLCSFQLLAAHEDLLVASASSPIMPPRVVVARSSSVSNPPLLADWHAVSLEEGEHGALVAEALRSVAHETISYAAPGSEEVVDAIVVAPRLDNRSRSNRPPLLYVHGGPHSAFTTTWSWPVIVAAMSGWSVVMPNYRGSIGFGEDSLQSLPGRVGSQDVSDSWSALAAAHSKKLCADPNATGVVCVGGSHGGFLSAHFAGQFPEKVRACVLRNPVCDISSLVSVSDIPDWCFKEALGNVSKFSVSPCVEELAAMRAKSPAAHADSAAQVPHLFLLGALDLRVPPSQGFRHAALLREKGAGSVETYVFSQDSHALSKPRTTLQQWWLTLGFLDRHSQARTGN